VSGQDPFRPARAADLEVERAFDGARALYRRAGFADHERLLMSKPAGRANR
jgi:ribosomal protein S18 acetylase RimI-like enzyme